MLEIRKMLKQDLEQVVKLEKEIFSSPWSRQSFEESFMRTDTLYLVGINKGSVVAYSGMFFVFDEASITNIAVDLKYRGQGIGKQILCTLLAQAACHGILNITLEVRTSNEAAIHLYESLGFKKEGVRKAFYTKPVEDALIMWRRSP